MIFYTFDHMIEMINFVFISITKGIPCEYKLLISVLKSILFLKQLAVSNNGELIVNVGKFAATFNSVVEFVEMKNLPFRINTLNFVISNNFKLEELLLNCSKKLTLCAFNDIIEST